MIIKIRRHYVIETYVDVALTSDEKSNAAKIAIATDADSRIIDTLRKMDFVAKAGCLASPNPTVEIVLPFTNS